MIGEQELEDEAGITAGELRMLMGGSRKQAREQAELEIAVLKKKPCMDCGRLYPTYVMDFDHRPGEVKLGSVSSLLGSAAPAQAVEETKKCDLVCSNCHRERTHGGRR
jgi:hypothetical protein